MSSPPPHHHAVRPPSPVIPVARHTFSMASQTSSRLSTFNDRAMNSHLLFHPPQMADDTAADAKTGDGSQKKKKKKRKKESDSLPRAVIGLGKLAPAKVVTTQFR